MTLIQSPNLVYGSFNFEMYSFVIKIAIDLKKAVELVNTIPILGFLNGHVEVVIADPDPKNISVISNNTFFYLFFYIFSYKFHYQF